MFVTDESGAGGQLDLGEERCEEIEDIQESARFGMQVQLGPGEDLAEFVHGAETAGQGHESIGEIRHESFAFVHGVDESEFCDAAVGKFPVFEKAGNDSDDLSATGERLTSRSEYHQGFWAETEPRGGRMLTPAGAISRNLKRSR